MKTVKKGICLILVVIVFFLASCTTGQYLALGKNENTEILGTVSAEFPVTGSFRYKKVINTQAYIHLMAAAEEKYSGNIDVRDITWVIGQGDAANNNYLYTAIGKVIRK